MAVTLTLTYMKKLGLPQYSSHSCSITVEVEVTDLAQVPEQSSNLYRLLQSSVDAEMHEVGFMPDVAYGIGDSKQINGDGAQSNANGHSSRQNGNTQQRTVRQNRNEEPWNCTDGQRGLILRLINENRLDKNEVESMAQQLFGCGVKQLDKLQASQLIEELFEKAGRPPQRSRWRGQPQRPPVAP
jgi:hypothetical protein